MKTTNKNKKCANQKLKQNFIIITCENMNMKGNKQVYGAKSCFKLLLNKLKVIGFSFLYFWGSKPRRLPWRFS